MDEVIVTEALETSAASETAASSEVLAELEVPVVSDALSVVGVNLMPGVQFPSWVGSQFEYTLIYPYSYTLPGEVLQIARDCVSGYSGDYFLFQYDADEYVLVLSDSLEQAESAFNCESFSAYDIQYVENTVTVQRSISGNLVGFEDGAAAEHFSGSFDAVEQRPSFYRLFYDTFEDTELHVSTADHAILYASVNGYASLHDASSHYGFATVVILSGMVMFYLINSIFRKVR